MFRQRLIGSAFVASSLLTWDSAAAQSLSDSEKIERLERQTELLREQVSRQYNLITALQEEVARTRKRAEKKEPEPAKRSEPPGASKEKKEIAPASMPEPKVTAEPEWVTSPASTDADVLRGTAPAVKLTLPQFAGVNLSWWGWVEAAGVFRNHNQVNDMLTVFDAIPYRNSPLYNEHEFHGSARQSQFSFLAEANIDASQKLSGYLETDFLGIGTESNYLDTNDWSTRLRHVYATYDNENWGFHILAGQNWSMMMPMEFGIVPRKELIPLTVNANYLVGYQFTDNWQVRFVKDFNEKLWLGVSLENPATSLAPGIPSTFDGLAVNVTNTGTGGFLNDVPVTPSVAPDVIEKVAWDPGWGHFEGLAIQRFFVDNVLCAAAERTGCITGTTTNKTTFGAGVGGNFLLPIVPNYLEVMGGVTYGRGIGRYGAGGLPDVTIAADGSLDPLTAVHAWSGIEYFPWKGLTLYGYAGLEQNQASYFGAYGYGNPGYDNSGCMTPTAASFAIGTSPTCVADNKQLFDAKIGFWQDIFNGPFGRFVVGAELEYLKRTSFPGIGGTVSTDNEVGYVSLRYYF